MAVKRMKLSKGDKVLWEDQPATVLNVTRSKVEIRDVYGYPRTVKRSELRPDNR